MLTFRELDGGDETAFLRLMRQVHELHAAHRPDIYQPFEEGAVRGYFREILTEPNGFALLAELAGVPVGLCVTLYREPSKNPVLKPRCVAFMEDLCVAEDCRGQGIGRALFAHARERAAADGMERLELMVWGFNEGARGFYERSGMEEKCRVLEMEL